MRFFHDPGSWRNELAAIGLAAGAVMFPFGFLSLGDPAIWLLASCIPLLLPVVFGPWLKMKLPALLLVAVAVFFWLNPRIPPVPRPAEAAETPGSSQPR